MIAVNTLIKWGQDNDKESVERILWLDRQQNLAYVINIYSNESPFPRCISDIEECIKQGIAGLLDSDPFVKVVDEGELSEKSKEIRDRAWEVIKELVTLEPVIFYKKERRELVLKASSIYNLHEKTVSNYLKRFWKRGKIKNALLPDYYLCGGPGKERRAGDKKRGRRRKNAELVGEGINVDEEVKKIFNIAINKYYHTGAKNSLKLAYELMRKEFFSDEFRIENGIRVPVIKPIGEVPTYAQFRYWYYKNINLKKQISSRQSSKKYEQQYRPLLGNTTSEAIAPGSIYQIDATVGDIYLVSRYNRNWIIGRPVIYGVIDVFSRMVVGIYVGLEGPSWIGAMMALANAASDKVAFCKEYGIDIEEKDWPVHHLPEAILADRGELEGKNVENLINSLHVKIQNTPPYRADWKAVIEQHFRITNIRVKPLLPGTVDPDVRERGDRDYRLDAKLDIYQFTQIIIKCALYHNNQYHLKNYDREEMMVADEVECIPREIWNWGIANCAGKLRSVPEDIVKLNLMPSDAATVTAKGIKFKGLYYASPKTLKERWFEKARNKGTWKIDVSYDPRNMNFIYIKEQNGMDFEKCFLLEHQDRYKDKNLEEIQYLLEEEKLQIKIAEDKELQAKVDLITEIESIAKEAEKSFKEEKSNESDSKRKKGIRNNRRLEKMLNREKEAFELDKKETGSNAEVIPFSRAEQEEEVDENDTISLLIRKQKEALKKIHE
ncbi:MAG: DDE-type integrase/transposase/recombinase [Clostridium sp.]|jgi:hypothetical protein|nr:DDE-type integrase/transposase/recombinase [Clostridium sp.]